MSQPGGGPEGYHVGRGVMVGMDSPGIGSPPLLRFLLLKESAVTCGAENLLVV